jgi:glycosyltransferase involved in cell wall biosynthesis
VSRWIWLAAGVILGADWLRRSIASSFGMKRLAKLVDPEWDKSAALLDGGPSVTVVVPARNEAENIEQCLRSLIGQDYSKLTICTVDDRSSDATGRIMDQLQRKFPEKLRVIHVSELPAGWLGKTHAMWLAASERPSDWILFTDGDVMFRSDALRRALTYAEAQGCDHLMLFPTMVMKSFGERMMLGFFALVSTLIIRPWKVRDPKTKTFIGAGAFNLIRRSAYEELGTYAALRLEVIDDLMLGRAVKEQGLAQDCAIGSRLVMVRWAEGAFGVVRNLQKNMFSLLNFSWPLAMVAAFGATLYHIGPWVGVILAPGIAKLGFAIAIFAIVLAYARVAPIFEVSPWMFVTQPVASMMLVYALVNSAVSSLLHRGVRWRGTTYSVREIQAFNTQARRKGEERRRRLSNRNYTGPERRNRQNLASDIADPVLKAGK